MTLSSSLVRFHRVLISAGILFCGGFAVWSFLAGSRTGRGAWYVLGAIFAVLAVVLSVYLWNLRRVLGYRDERTSRR